MVEFLAVGAIETDAHAGSGSDRNHPALQMALEVEREVEMARAHPDEKGQEGKRRTAAIVDDQLVEPGMAFEHRLRLGFDRPRDMRGRPRAADTAEQRQRAHHVADRAEQDDQDAARRGAGFGWRRRSGGFGGRIGGGHAALG